MEVIDRFGSLAEHLIADRSVQRYGLIIARHGLKGLEKLNPATVWLDAGISVCQAYSAYQGYAAECEVTRQLELETRVLRRELDATLTSLKLEFAVLAQHDRNRVEIIQKALEVNRADSERIVREIAGRMDFVCEYAAKVRQAREQSVRDFRQIQELQKTLDVLLRTSLICVLVAVDSH